MIAENNGSRMLVWGATLSIAILGMFNGCNSSKPQSTVATVQDSAEMGADEAAANQAETLKTVMRDIPKMILLERRVASLETTRNLNSWMQKQSSEGWQRAAAIDSLPEYVAHCKWSEELARPRFEEAHSEFIFQCQTFRKLHDWVVEQPYRDELLHLGFGSRREGWHPTSISGLNHH